MQPQVGIHIPTKIGLGWVDAGCRAGERATIGHGDVGYGKPTYGWEEEQRNRRSGFISRQKARRAWESDPRLMAVRMSLCIWPPRHPDHPRMFQRGSRILREEYIRVSDHFPALDTA